MFANWLIIMIVMIQRQCVSNEVEVIGSGTSVQYFAKDNGLISTLMDICVQTKDTCSKITEEITTIN